ncbi:MAG: hypothetical protein AB7K71_13725 [Polyangiaceae bacterium]
MADALIEALLTAAEAAPTRAMLAGESLGTPEEEALVAASSQLASAFHRGDTLRPELSERLASLPPHTAAWCSILLGAAVEDGAPAAVSVEGLLSCLDSWLEQLPRFPEDEEPMLEDDDELIVDALPGLCQALVSHLAALPERRRELLHDEAMVERLDEVVSLSVGAFWLLEALKRSSGDLIIVHVPSRKGLELRYENVSNCFALFSLIQNAVGKQLPGGEAPRPDLSMWLLHRDGMPFEGTDHAWWHYGSPLSPEPDLTNSVWGEMLVQELPTFPALDAPGPETRVILLWPPLLQSRTWDAGFLTPHIGQLPASVELVSELSTEDCEAWLGRLGIPRAGQSASESQPPDSEPPPKRAFWKFWQRG